MSSPPTYTDYTETLTPAAHDDTRARIRPGWVRPDLFPFESRFAAVDGHRIHYIDEGSGPALLFVHSGPAWSFYYREFVLGLRDRFRCIAFDLPGFGLSTAPAGFGYSLLEHSRVVEHFIEHLDLSALTLAVHDSGGPVALGAVVRQPERFRAFILTSTFGWSLADYPQVRFMLRLVGSPPLRQLNNAFNLLPRMIANFGPRRRKLSREEKTGLTGAFRTWAHRDRIPLLFRDLPRQGAHLAEVERGLRQGLADRPALILFGEVDPVRRLGFQQRWESIFPRHLSRVIAREQHFAHLGAAQEMIGLVGDFWPLVEDRP
jgi:haloalkane dehalogenase